MKKFLVVLFFLLIFNLSNLAFLNLTFASTFTNEDTSKNMAKDIEKPKPEFSEKNNKISAKFIPRGKNTSVFIDFEAKNAKIAKVSGLEFSKYKSESVNHLDFRSDLFLIELKDVKKGSEVEIILTSNFFTGSTEYWLVNLKKEIPWLNSSAKSYEHPQKIRSLVFKVKDGDFFDLDGKENGEITISGGPKDSFWGYALGTLFIRFFGIFIVLGFLNITMGVSGKIFQSLEKKLVKDSQDSSESNNLNNFETLESFENKESKINSEVKAAIALALHIYLNESSGSKISKISSISSESKSNSPNSSNNLDLSTSPSSFWVQEGRFKSCKK